MTLCSGTSLAPRLAGFTVPARPTRDKSQWENVISCGGGQVFLVRLGSASSAVRAVHIATVCSVKVGSSISVSFWLRMPGHGGAGSRSRNGLFCVPWARCTRAVAPCLLCEELAVILVVGGGCGASAHPCEASASGLLSLGSSHPSTGSVGGGAGPGLTRSCLPGHFTASDLVSGPWTWLPRLSPAIRLPGLGLDLAFWVFHVWFFSGSPSGSGWGVLCFRHGFVTLCSGTSLAPRLAGFTVPARPTRDKSQWENVISCGGGQVFLVRLGGASSAVRAVHIATVCSVKVGSSISVSFWLRMPGHGGAGSRSRNGLFFVPCSRCTRAVAPCLLCEELAVILVVGGGCGASAHPCEASASGLLSLGSSHPSTGSVGGGAGPGLTRSCSPGHFTASDLVSGPWTWLPRVACHPSPSHGLARLGGLCMSPLFEMLSVLFPGNIGSHFFGISRFFCGNV